MGWTGTHRPKGLTNKEYFQENFGPNYEILETSQQRGGPLYMAVRHPKGYVFGAVFLIQWGRGYYNFHYKDIDESMGPSEDQCPEKILRLLSPLDHPEAGFNDYAREWRERCWANVERRKAQPKVSKGSIVVFKHPITFTDGMECDTFAYVKGSQFLRLDTSSGKPVPAGYCRITKWRDREWGLGVDLAIDAIMDRAAGSIH